MVSLLKMKQNVKFLAICTDCLHLLGYGCSQAKVQMVQAEASVQLVHIMNTYTYEKVLTTQMPGFSFGINLALVDNITCSQSTIMFKR